MVKVVLVFFLSCSVRESERQWINNNISGIKSILMKSPLSCQWLLSAFTLPQYIREFQLECPIKVVRKYVITLLEAAIITVSKQEGMQKIYEVGNNDAPASLVAALINQWILTIREIKGSVRYYSEFFDLFYRFARISNEYTMYLLSKRVLGRLLDFYLDNIYSSKKQISSNQEEIRRTEDIRTLNLPYNPNEYFG
jgi:hypothetical protein